jgi:hypothetical protein
MSTLSEAQLELKSSFEEVIGGGIVLTDAQFHYIYNCTMEVYPNITRSQMIQDAIIAVGAITNPVINISESQGNGIVNAAIAYFNLINNIPNASANIVFDLPLNGTRTMQHDITLNGDYDQTYDVVEQWSTNVLHVPISIDNLSGLFSSVTTSGEDVTDVTMDITSLKNAIAAIDASFFIRELQTLDATEQMWNDQPQFTLHALLDGSGSNVSLPSSLLNARARNAVREEVASVNTQTTLAQVLDTISNVEAKDYRLHFYNDVSAAGGLNGPTGGVTLGFLLTYDVSYSFTFTISEDNKVANPTPSSDRLLYYSTTTNTQYELPSLTESYSNADVRFAIKFHVQVG